MTRPVSSFRRTVALVGSVPLLSLWTVITTAPSRAEGRESGAAALQQPAATPPGSPRPCAGCGTAPEPLDPKDYTGWTQIFDGSTLAGWDGNPDVWKVENGAITAESTAQRRLGSTYVIWRGGEPARLRVEARDQSRFRHPQRRVLPRQGRSELRPAPAERGGPGPATCRGPATANGFAVPADPKWNVTGYSLDFDYDRDNDGNVQDTSGRGETQIVWRGHIVRMEAGKRPRSIGSLGDREALMSKVMQGEWNAAPHHRPRQPADAHRERPGDGDSHRRRSGQPEDERA